MAEQPNAGSPMLEQWNHWLQRTDRIRSTTRWSLGAIAVGVSLAVGLSPLTNIGSLEPGWRLGVALTAAAAGVAAMGWSFLAAVEVLKVRLIDIRAIAESIEFTSLRSELDRILKPRLPIGIYGVRQLVGKFFRVRRLVETNQLHPELVPTVSDQNEMNSYVHLQQAVDRLTEIAGFVLAQDLFERFCKRLTRSVVVTAAAFFVFAWAANPPKSDEPGGKGSVQLSQASLFEVRDDGTPCAGQPGADAGSVACASASAPASQAIPRDCVTMLVADGKATCVESDASAELDVRLGRTYALLRPASFDLSRSIAGAIADLAASGRPAPGPVVARRVAERVSASFATDFGKPLANRLFARGTAVPADQAATAEADNPALNVWFSLSPDARQGGEIRYQAFDAAPFDTDSSALGRMETWGPRLSALSAHAAANRCRVEIVGFADRRGTASYNLYLAMQRASALQRWIMASTRLPRQSISVYATGGFGVGCESDERPDLACNRHVEVSEMCGVGVGY